MTGMILTIIGLILTIGFGIYAIVSNKRTRKKVSLSFGKNECYSLFKKDINRLNIDVNYKGESLNNYLILFKGVIENSGNLDIDKNRIYTPLKIISKKEYKWLETTVSGHPNGATVSIYKIADNEIEINWDLIKKGEKIEFEALVEIPFDNELEKATEVFYESLKFDFRITDLNGVDKIQDYNSEDYKRTRAKKNLLFIGIVTFFTGGGILLASYLGPIKTNVQYELTGVKDTIFVEIGSKNGNLITIKNDSINIDKPIVEFNKEYKIQKVNNVVQEDKQGLFSLIIGVIYIIISSFILWRALKKTKTTTNTTKL